MQGVCRDDLAAQGAFTNLERCIITCNSEGMPPAEGFPMWRAGAYFRNPLGLASRLP